MSYPAKNKDNKHVTFIVTGFVVIVAILLGIKLELVSIILWLFKWFW